MRRIAYSHKEQTYIQVIRSGTIPGANENAWSISCGIYPSLLMITGCAGPHSTVRGPEESSGNAECSPNLENRMCLDTTDN